MSNHLVFFFLPSGESLKKKERKTSVTAFWLRNVRCSFDIFNYTLKPVIRQWNCSTYPGKSLPRLLPQQRQKWFNIFPQPTKLMCWNAECNKVPERLLTACKVLAMIVPVLWCVSGQALSAVHLLSLTEWAPGATKKQRVLLEGEEDAFVS